MHFHEPVDTIIQRRKSCRSYIRQALPPEFKTRIIDFISETHSLPFPENCRIELVEKRTVNSGEKIKLGTYGFIDGAESFLCGIIKKEHNSIESFGFLFEKVVLFCTSIGLSTCWLAGSVRRNDFALRTSLKDDELIVVVSPVGFTRENPTIRDSFIRLVIQSKQRKPWNELFFHQSFNNPLLPSDAGIYEKPLEMVRLAPSASNRQPWRVIKVNNRFDFYLKRTTGYTNFGNFDIQRSDIGIAMAHFELSTSEMGISGKWSRESNSSEKDMVYIASYCIK